MKRRANKVNIDFSNIVISATFIRVLVKVLIFLGAFYYHFPLENLSILLLVFILNEIYKSAGTLWIQKGGPEFVIGSLVSAVDGVVIIWLLNAFHLINTDVYLFILLSIILNTIEFGLDAAFAEGVTAGLSYGFILLFINYPIVDIIQRVPLLIFLGFITGWLSTELKKSRAAIAVVKEENKHEQKLNDIKDDFIAIASHNFNTPLTVLSGYLYLFLNHRLGDLTNDQIKILESMDRNTNTLKVLLDDFLQIVSLESSKLKLIQEPVPLKEYFDGFVGDFNALAKAGQKDFIYNNKLNTQIAVIDSVRFRIAIENVVENAVKFARKNVTLVISATDEKVIISIVDDGKGIEAKYLKKIFHKYNYIKSGIQTPTEEKSGLGLYISKIIILGHKGNIKVNSILNEGTEFKITLPLK